MTAKNKYRNHNGQFGYFGDFERLCKCGHTLGLHIAGGHECGTSAETKGCQCIKFTPVKRGKNKCLC